MPEFAPVTTLTVAMPRTVLARIGSGDGRLLVERAVDALESAPYRRPALLVGQDVQPVADDGLDGQPGDRFDGEHAPGQIPVLLALLGDPRRRLGTAVLGGAVAF